ncbi:MAG: CBU_0592 family membrane protein [Candidatus Zixiibacteriota bacterium]
MGNYNIYLGVLGMLLLLTAFALNLMKIKSQDSLTYIIMNIFGGGISTYYAVALEAVPFVILEAVWTAFALYKLITLKRQVKHG